MYFLRYTVPRREEGSTSKAHSTLSLKPTRTKKIEQLGKKTQNYKNAHAENSVFEQKPIKIDDFNELKEREVKERVEKRIMKGREVAEKDKLL